MKRFKVLGVEGSPRKDSTTEKLLRVVERGIVSEGGYFRLVKLAESQITPCQGCVSYYGECNLQICVEKDGSGVEWILRLMLSSDAIVFATPVYWFGPSGIMKNLIDRMTCLEHKQKLLDGKIGGIVCTYEDEGASQAISQLFLALSDMGLAFPPYAYTYNRGDKLEKETIFYAEQMGKNILRMASLLHGKRWWGV